MQLTVWTYEGPPHVGVMRIAASMRNAHLVLHAPQGDSYADLLFTMIQRDQKRPPVSYTTFQARDLGGDTAALFQRTLRDTYERFQPEVILVAASCTAELIQDDPAGLAQALGLPVTVVPVELSAYSKKENWGAAEAFYRVARSCVTMTAADATSVRAAHPRSCNILGPTALGFRHRDDVTEVTSLLRRLGIEVHVVAPQGASAADLARLPEAAFNIVLYPEIAGATASWLQRSFGQPSVTIPPLGVGATREFVAAVKRAAGLDAGETLDDSAVRLPWYSRSVDATYLTGKRVFVFGDGTHALAAARIAKDELGFTVCGLGTYSRELAREVRAAAAEYGVTPLVTDDYLAVEQAIVAASPELVLGTQMERHIAKRLGIPCAVISAPVHVEDFPARYSPQMGWEGANVIFDTWVHPLMMGLEEHLLSMFRDDFEFRDGHRPSHLGAHTAAAAEPAPVAAEAAGVAWSGDAELELGKIPFFVRGKARRNTERYATERGIATITLDTLYNAKAHFGR